MRTTHDGLVALVLGVVADDLVAGALLAPQLLRTTVGVVGDDRVGRVEDRLRAAVVLVEHDRRQVRERILELVDVPHIRTTEAVDRVVDEDPVRDVRVRVRDLEVVHRPVVVDDVRRP